MNKTWKPIVAGAIGIIVGILQAQSVMVTLYAIKVEIGPVDAKAWLLVAILTLLALLAIVGGIYHIRRTKWPLAIAGSIAVFVCFARYAFARGPWWDRSDVLWIEVVLLLPGIATIVLTVLSRKEFK